MISALCGVSPASARRPAMSSVASLAFNGELAERNIRFGRLHRLVLAFVVTGGEFPQRRAEREYRPGRAGSFLPFGFAQFPPWAFESSVDLRFEIVELFWFWRIGQQITFAETDGAEFQREEC